MQLSLGIDALDGVASATIFLDLDASATLQLQGNVQGTAEGCVDLSTGLAVNAGAQGNFFDLFDDSTQVALFNRDFDIFNVGPLGVQQCACSADVACSP